MPQSRNHERPSYQPPRVVCLKPQLTAAGFCGHGSGDLGVCNSGSIADGICSQPGSSPGDFCVDGQGD